MKKILKSLAVGIILTNSVMSMEGDLFQGDAQRNLDKLTNVSHADPDYRSSLTDEKLREIIPLLPHVRTLDIRQLQIGKNHAEDLRDALIHNTTIQEVIAYSGKFLKLLPPLLRENKTIKKLTVYSRKIEGEDLEEIAKALIENDTVTYLNLSPIDSNTSNINFKPKAEKQLEASLRVNTTLQEVHLDGRCISPWGANAIKGAFLSVPGRIISMASCYVHPCFATYNGDTLDLGGYNNDLICTPFQTTYR